MRTLLAPSFCWLLAASLFAQKTVLPPPPAGEQPVVSGRDVATPKADEYITVNPHLPPSFPGGDRALLTFLAQNTWWPPACDCAQSRIVVQFEVDTLGDCRNWEIIKTPDPCFEPVVAAIFAKMPCWSPGELQGRKVPVRFTLPIRVHLK